MPKIKIVFFTVSGAGVKRHLLDIALNLDNQKYEVIGIFPDKLFSNAVSKDPQFTYRAIFEKAGLKHYILEIPRYLSPWIDLKAIWQLRKILQSERPAILHCHSSLAGALGRLAVLTMSRPKPTVVYTPHTMFYHLAEGLKKSIYWGLEKILWPHADAIIAVGDSEYSMLCRDFTPTNKLKRINNGLDIESDTYLILDARETLCKELNLDKDILFILSLARLEHPKDVLTLIRAFILVADKYPKAVLLLAGGGTNTQIKEAQELIEKANLSRRIFLLGWRDDPNALLSAADVVALSTHHEGLPYALLEAMAFEKPLLGSRTQGVIDCIVDGENGFLFDKGNEVSCAKCLECLLRDSKLRKRMGSAGAKLVREKFSLTDMQRDIEQLYTDILLAKGDA